MTSTVLYKTHCPKCREKGKDHAGDNLAVYSDGHSYCYSCGFYTGSNLTKLKQPLKKNVIFELPEDLDSTLVGEPLQWLKKYYSIPDIPNNIYWSESTQKLYFLIYIDNKLVAYQYRYFGDNPKHPKWVSTGVNDNLLYIQGAPSQTLVLVEDIISMDKVSKVQQCLCLFGSNITNNRLANLFLFNYKKIIIWLDPDKDRESINFFTTCLHIGFDCQTIFTAKDPKDYSIEEIKEILQ